VKQYSRKVVSVILVALLVPFVMYGASPLVIAQVLKWKIGEHGYDLVEIQVGYPTSTSITLGPLILEGTSAGRPVALRIDKIVAEYTLSQLLGRRVENISIQEVSLEIQPPQDSALNSQEASPVGMDTALVSSLTLGALLHPIPSLPMQSLEVGKFILIERSISQPERAMEVSGGVTQDNGMLSGVLNITGSHIPPSKMSFQGTSLADVHVSLTSTQQSDSPALHISSVLTEDQEVVTFKGKVEIDVEKIIPYIEPFIPLPQEIPSVTGKIQASWTGALPQNVSLPSVVNHPEGELDGTIRLNLDIPHIAKMGKDLSITLDSQFSVKNNRVMWNMSEKSRVSGHVNLAELSVLDHAIESNIPNQADVTLTVKEPLQGEATLAEESLTAHVKGRVDVLVQTHDPVVRVRASLLEGSINNGNEMGGKGTFDVSGSWPDLAVKSGKAASIQWDCGGEWKGNQQEWQAKIVQGCVLSAKEVRVAQAALPYMRVTVLQPMEARWDGLSQNWQVESTKLNIQMPHIHWEDQIIGLGNSTLQLKVVQGNAKSLVHTQGEMVVLGITLPPQEGIQIPPLNGKVGFVGNPESITVNVLAQIPQWQVTTKARVRHGIPTNQGGAVWAVAPVIFSPTTFSLSQLISPWPHPFDVTSGQISATGKVSWELPVGPQSGEAFRYHGGATVEGKGLSGVIQKFLVEDVNFVGTVTKGEAWEMSGPATITIQSINPGIPVHDISLEANIIQNDSDDLLLHLQKIVAHTLGGTISIDELSMDSVTRTSDFIVTIDQLQLAEILKLEQQEGLDGTGVLDGVIPVHVSMEGAEIEKGTVKARPPGGIIHFHASPETSQTLSQYNVNMDIVLGALKNFHYDVLDVEINYDQDGRLVLHMKLQGKNPEFKKSRPIHFNLQVEENIPALLKSLQITKGIEEQIEKLFQEGCCY